MKREKAGISDDEAYILASNINNWRKAREPRFNLLQYEGSIDGLKIVFIGDYSYCGTHLDSIKISAKYHEEDLFNECVYFYTHHSDNGKLNFPEVDFDSETKFFQIYNQIKKKCEEDNTRKKQQHFEKGREKIKEILKTLSVR